MSFHFIDLFAGAGGLSCGLEMAGHSCLLGVDFNADAMLTFAANHPKAQVYCGPIQKLSTKKIRELTEHHTIDLIVGGPPCQGFSTVGKGDPKDKRNTLFLEFVRIVKDIRPSFIVLENVTGLMASKNAKTLAAILAQFEKLGYLLSVQVVSMERYGIPERRRRTIIIGSRTTNSPIPFPVPTHKSPITVGDVLFDLKTGEGEIFNHDIEKAHIKSQIDRERLHCIPEGRGVRYEEDQRLFLPKRLHYDVVWEEMPEGRFRQTRLQRLDRTKPSPTILTSAHMYYHPTEDRYLTVREAAKIQTFPNHFIFKGSLSSQWKQVGNAVPPLIGKVLGEYLKNYPLTPKTAKKVKKTKEQPSSLEHIHRIREEAFRYEVS